MKIQMEDWEIQRVVEKVSDVLHFWMYDSIEVSAESGHKMSMSKETFIESLTRSLKD